MPRKPSTSTTPKKRKPSPLAAMPKNTRRAAEFWADIFPEVLTALMHELHHPITEQECIRRVELAGATADHALSTYEKRWPGLYL